MSITLPNVIRQININVKLTFFFSFFNSLGRGIWLGNVFSAYIYFIAGKDNVLLGWTSVAMGVTMTILVFPAGLIADRIRRDTALLIAAILGTLSLSIMLVFGNNIYWIFAALVFWGAFQGFNRPALEALLADSIQSRKRSKTYVWLNLVRQSAMAIGPFLNVILFVFLGNEWDIDVLRIVMIAGILISAGSIFSLLFFSDDYTLGEKSEAIDIEEINGAIEQPSKMKFKNIRLVVPSIILLSNLIVGMGAGMTIKFFPIFFIEIYQLKPIAVQIIMGVTFIATGVASLIARAFSLKRGRVIIIFIFQAIATLCLLFIAFYPPLMILVPLFIARGSLMNAGEPLARSLIMDYVPKKYRGTFNSLQAIAWGLFWNFSAVIGGYLIGKNNRFYLCFFTTTAVYTIGVLLLLLIIPYDIKEIK